MLSAFAMYSLHWYCAFNIFNFRFVLSALVSLTSRQCQISHHFFKPPNNSRKLQECNVHLRATEVSQTCQNIISKIFCSNRNISYEVLLKPFIPWKECDKGRDTRICQIILRWRIHFENLIARNFQSYSG